MQKQLKYNIRTLRKRTLVLFLLFSILLPFFAAYPQTPELHAVPSVNISRTIRVPLIVGTHQGAQYWDIFVMRNSTTNQPVYCTRRGLSAPSSNYALLTSTINNNPRATCYISVYVAGNPAADADWQIRGGGARCRLNRHFVRCYTLKLRD